MLDTAALRGNNLSDLTSTATARTNLGLGTAAVKNVPASGNAASTEVVLGSDTRLRGDTVEVDATAAGVPNDGATLARASLQTLIDTYKGLVDVGNFVKSVTIVLPPGTYLLDAPLKIYSSINIRGYGQATRLKASSSFSGNALIELTGITGSNFCSYFSLDNLRGEATAGTSIALVRAVAADVVNCRFTRIDLNCPYGLILGTYTQQCVIDTLTSNGAVDQILLLKGNDNRIFNVDKEGATGATTDPYILIQQYAQLSAGNELHNILIEQTTSANKTPLVLDGCRDTTLDGFWFEGTASNGYAIKVLNNQGFTRFRGYLTVSNTHKIQVINTVGIAVERFFTTKADTVWEMDSTSEAVFDSLQTQYGENLYQIDSGRMRIGRHIHQSMAQTRPAGYVPYTQQRFTTAQNILKNPSFEAGEFSWTYASGTPATRSLVQSEVGTGLMLRLDHLAAGQITQNVTVPVEWVGRPLTFAVLVKTTSAATIAWCAPLISGAGITASNGYNRAFAGLGWQIISQTFIPQASGTVSVGVYFVGTTTGDTSYVDECVLAFGTEVPLNSAKFGSFTLGGGR